MTRRELFKTALAGLVAAPVAAIKEEPKEQAEEVIVDRSTIVSPAGTTIFCTFSYTKDGSGKWEKKVIRKDVLEA